MKFYKHDSWEYGKSNSVWWRTWDPTSFIEDSKEKYQNTLWRKNTGVNMLSSAEDPPNNYVSQENPLQTPCSRSRKTVLLIRLHVQSHQDIRW